MRQPAASRVRWGAVLFQLLLLGVVLAMVANALTLRAGAGQLPLLIGVPTALCLALSVVAEFSPGLARRFEGGVELLLGQVGGRAEAEGEADQGEQLPLRRFLVGAAWLLFFFLLVLFLGFFAATAIFVASFLRLFAGYRWWKVLLYTALLVAAEWYSFDELFRFDLWKGAAPELVPGFVGGDVLPPFL